MNKTINQALLQIGIFLQLVTGLRFEQPNFETRILQIPTQYDFVMRDRKRSLRINRWNKPREFWLTK